MRVIAGTARGRRLKVPKGVTRPSTDRLREALFSILAPRLEGARVLDLFAGSGALGVEALSRGAQSAIFVEEDGGACGVIEANLREAGGASARVHRGDVFRFLSVLADGFDLVFADPPYAGRDATREDLAARLLRDKCLPGLVAKDGLLVLEVEAEREGPTGPDWELLQRRCYGGSSILFYEHAGDS